MLVVKVVVDSRQSFNYFVQDSKYYCKIVTVIFYRQFE